MRLQYDKVGRPTNLVDSIAGTIRLAYDSLDRLTQAVHPNGTVTCQYNDVGLRTNMTVTGETAVTYRYDNVHRLTNVVQGTTITSLFQDDTGRRTKLVLPNGINVLYFYDTASRVTNITYEAAVTNRIDYTYFPDGNRASQASAFSTYRTGGTATGLTYNAANQVTVWNDSFFNKWDLSYDANGNLTNIYWRPLGPNMPWSWNARNQLTNFVQGSSTFSFRYDGLGRRISRTQDGVTQQYVYDGLDVVLETDGAGVVQSRLLRGRVLDEVYQRIDVGSPSTNRVYYTDALGSVIGLLETNREVVTSYGYMAHGRTYNSGAASNNRYKFTSREDEGVQVYYYRARYYHAVLGRFVSEDPIENAGGDINLYGYALNDPINLFDWAGQDAEHTKNKRPSTKDKHTAADGRPKCGARPGHEKPTMPDPTAKSKPKGGDWWKNYKKSPQYFKGPKTKPGGFARPGLLGGAAGGIILYGLYDIFGFSDDVDFIFEQFQEEFFYKLGKPWGGPTDADTPILHECCDT